MNADPRIKAALAAVSPERARFLDTPRSRLLWREMRLGWHFCPEFDEMATPGEQLDREGCCAFCGFDKRKVRSGRSPFEVVAVKLLTVLAKRTGVG